MARTGSTAPNDYTHPIKNCGSFNTGEKQALIRTTRAVTGKTVNAQVSNTTATAVVVPELSFKVVKNKRYRIVGKLLVNGTGGTGGIKLGFNYAGSSATPTIVVKTISAAAIAAEVIATVNSQGTGAAAQALEIDIDGTITADVNGVLQLTVANTTGAQAALVNPGSWMAVTRV